MSPSQPVGTRPPSPAPLKRIASSLRAVDTSLSQIAALDRAVRDVGWPTYKAYPRVWKEDRENTPLTPQFEVTFDAALAASLLRKPESLKTEGVELGRAEPLGVTGWCGLACAQVLTDGVAQEASAAGNHSDGQLLSQGPAPDNTQYCHVYHSWSPTAQKRQVGVGTRVRCGWKSWG